MHRGFRFCVNEICSFCPNSGFCNWDLFNFFRSHSLQDHPTNICCHSITESDLCLEPEQKEAQIIYWKIQAKKIVSPPSTVEFQKMCILFMGLRPILLPEFFNRMMKNCLSLNQINVPWESFIWNQILKSAKNKFQLEKNASDYIWKKIIKHTNIQWEGKLWKKLLYSNKNGILTFWITRM